VKEAEQYAEADRIRKEAIDVKNNAESMIFQTEKALTDLGDKVEEAEKEKVESELSKLKSLNEGMNADSMSEEDAKSLKEATESLTQAFYAISEKLYSQAAEAQQQAEGNDGEGPINPDDIVDGN